MFDIAGIPALNDNYIWSVFDENGSCVVVDPGQAAPVIAFLHHEELTLTAILITHHHPDHTSGIAELSQLFSVPVYGPACENIKGVTHPLQGGETLHLDSPSLRFHVLAVPGHTRGHLAYYAPHMEPPALFSGDTLFSGGCGRLFEGTPEEMLASLDKLAALPGNTRLCCAHEYTQRNLEFATHVCSGNVEMANRLRWAKVQRQKNLSTLPSTLAIELLTNPFLRIDTPELNNALSGSTAAGSRAEKFSVLRRWKDTF